MAAQAGGPTAPADLGQLEKYDQARALTLKEARKLILNSKREPIHAEVMRKWSTAGCYPRGRDGPRIILPTLKVGRVNMTMPGWVEAFREMRERLSVKESPQPVERPARTRRAAQKRAARRLDEAGIGIAKGT